MLVVAYCAFSDDQRQLFAKRFKNDHKNLSTGAADAKSYMYTTQRIYKVPSFATGDD
jgi:hypothetical protein